ncbi:MAG: PhzF family phenazine biosynthesis protein [Pseudomonadota bacterium]|nr:PhzF family phenazine biosynthesis protein [Pseudomonadota bacterium]
MSRAYCIVDVFTAAPLLGNPVAVVLDAEGLDTERMQAIARWTNLSDTTFLLPPTIEGADYSLRIFTPRGELPFAGHPTLGSAHAAIAAGRMPAGQARIVQQCGVGRVPIAIEGEIPHRMLRFDLPEGTVTALAASDCDELDAALGSPVLRAAAPSIINVGAVWIVAEVESPGALMAIRPDPARLAVLERGKAATGVSLFARYDDGTLEVRSFAASSGIAEDPVCGTGNGSIALFRLHHGRVARGDGYGARQGRCIGRDGHVHIAISTQDVIGVGGATVTVARGTLDV